MTWLRTPHRLLTRVVAAAAGAVLFVVAPGLVVTPSATAAPAYLAAGCYNGIIDPVPLKMAAIYFAPQAGSPLSDAPTALVDWSKPSFNLNDCSGGAVPVTGIDVGPLAAVVFHGTDKRDGSAMVSAWGAADVAPTLAATPLVLNPPQPNTPWADFVPSPYVSVMEVPDMLAAYGTCRSCDFSDFRSVTLPGVPTAVQQGHVVGYMNDLSNAVIPQATITGIGERYVFDGANLTESTLQADLVDASFRGTMVDGAAFVPSGPDASVYARLSGATFDSLAYSNPPTFAGSVIGESGIPATRFTNTDLRGVSFQGVRCPTTGGQPPCPGPVFAGSQVPVGTVGALVAQKITNAQYSGATIVSSVSDQAALAGADLTGADLTDFVYTGVPLDLTGTKFDGATLTGANLARARLHGASFTGRVNAAGASFQGADLSSVGTTVPGADFAGADLQGADFSSANVSHATFVAADLSHADFTGARAAYTDFTGVTAKSAVFAQAHLYGTGDAFDNATNLQGADFTGAVLAADASGTGGFDLTQTDLSGAHFDRAVCVSCNFSGTTLTNATFVSAYLPGVILTGATVGGVTLDRAWLYCGTLENAECQPVAGSAPAQWTWPLALGADETFPPVVFGAPNLNGVDLSTIATCPDGTSGKGGCRSLLPDPAVAPAIPSPCSASGVGSCPTTTSTLFTSSPAAPISIAQDVSPTWNTALTPAVTYVGYDDSTIRSTGPGGTTVVAGTSGSACPDPTGACGDGGPATAALLGRPAGLATGADGTLYVADSALHVIRAIAPSGVISTVAGSLQLSTANGVAVDPSGSLLVADGANGIRQIARNGAVTAYLPAGLSGSVVSVVVGNGAVYAATRSPDHLYAIDPGTRTAKVVVGTGQSGYNGTTGEFGLLPGTQVQIDQPAGLAMSPDGNVLFADTGNHLVRAYRPDTGFVLAPVAGTVVGGVPTSGSNANGLPSNQTQLKAPQAVAATTTQLVVIADTGNQRVLKTGPPPAPSFGSAPGAPSPPREAILVCQPGRSWSCTLQPKPAGVTLAHTGQITVRKGDTIVAGGHRVQAPRQSANTYLVTIHGDLTPGTYTITMTSGPGKPQVETVTITGGP